MSENICSQLPDELWHQIFSNISFTEQLNLDTVSRQFYRCLRSSLCETFDLSDQNWPSKCLVKVHDCSIADTVVIQSTGDLETLLRRRSYRPLTTLKLGLRTSEAHLFVAGELIKLIQILFSQLKVLVIASFEDAEILLEDRALKALLNLKLSNLERLTLGTHRVVSVARQCTCTFSRWRLFNYNFTMPKPQTSTLGTLSIPQLQETTVIFNRIIPPLITAVHLRVLRIDLSVRSQGMWETWESLQEVLETLGTNCPHVDTLSIKQLQLSEYKALLSFLKVTSLELLHARWSSDFPFEQFVADMVATWPQLKCLTIIHQQGLETNFSALACLTNLIHLTLESDGEPFFKRKAELYAVLDSNACLTHLNLMSPGSRGRKMSFSKKGMGKILRLSPMLRSLKCSITSYSADIFSRFCQLNTLQLDISHKHVLVAKEILVMLLSNLISLPATLRTATIILPQKMDSLDQLCKRYIIDDWLHAPWRKRILELRLWCYKVPMSDWVRKLRIGDVVVFYRE